MKINKDKYYTPINIANHCWDKVKEIIGFNNISEIIEPSCGNGSFFHYPLIKPDFGFDIEPECLGANILTQDFLFIPMMYKKNRLIIGNPPYGNHMNMAQKFFKKSVDIADYIAFILPISQYNNTQSLFEFDLIYSEDLGEQIYSDRKLHCCFNIYKRPKNGLNQKSTTKLKWVKICRQDSKQYNNFEYDIRFCYWGDGTAGKILEDNEQYAGEYKIAISSDCPFKKDVLEYIKTFNWREYIKGIAMRRIKQYQIIDVLKTKFPEIK